MEKPKYLYKNSKCVGGTSSTVSLINAWISVAGQRNGNVQKYRSIACLGGVTIIAFAATIWFLSHSTIYTIKYDDTKGKSDKPDKPCKSKKGVVTKLDKRSNGTNKSSVGWWSSIREKIANKLGFGKKSKSKNAKSGKLPGPRKPTGKKRTLICSSTLLSKRPNGTTDLNKLPKVKGTRIANNDNLQRKDQITRETLVESYDDSSPNSNNLQQKDQVTQKIQVVSYSDDSSSINNNLHQNVQITQETQVESCGSYFSKNDEVKQQPLQKLKVREVRSNWTNRYKLPSRDRVEWLGECSKSKHPEEVNLTSPIHNVKCLTKPSCQDIDNKESNHQDHSLINIEVRIAEAIKKISLIDLQARENYQEFYIPYIPLTLYKTFDKIGQDRVERYKKLLVKLGRQKQQDSNLEFILQMVKELYNEKKYYFSEGDDFREEQADNPDKFDDFFKKLEQDILRTKAISKDNINLCSRLVDILLQDEEASRKRIERNFEILKMIDSYRQQGKETEENIKKSIKMFNEQIVQCKGTTRHLKDPSTFHDELNQFKDRLMDAEQQAKDLAISLDDMEANFAEILELFNDDNKLNTAVTSHGPILIDDD